MNIAIFSLLLIALVIGGVFIGKSRQFGLRPGMRRVRSVAFLAYLVLLVISGAVGFILYEANAFHQSEYYETENERLIEALRSGDLEQVNEKHLLGQYSFRFEGEELDLQALVNTYELMIIKEIVDSADLEVFHYSGLSHVDGYDITNKFAPLRAGLDEPEDRLWLATPMEDTIKVNVYESVFPARQFSYGGGNASFHTENLLGPQVIYLKVPEVINLNISNAEFQEVYEVKR
ncbi:hypothetical protein CR205_10395 [Alteribacter lacisalsi]|uniref:Uncharacterized protein n=1 Tax=Alteribacter lacisalsi TaxID=2045244 RepID=A0A2W0HAR9_9BACI|nr:hypothetical protein [Alteribacter lacisalsi]PYZ98953.1 hypothetical protein CR205_10395 [Alteribacter lacisalsi]